MTRPWANDRAARTTSAASHPELSSGDIAIPPRPYVSITSMNRSVAETRRPTITVAALAVAALLSITLFRGGASNDGDNEKQRLAQACMQWHLAASGGVSRLVQSTSDADLLQASNMIFLMRRAQRNCEAGRIALACQDYHSVTAGVPGYALTNQIFPCPRIAKAPPHLD